MLSSLSMRLFVLIAIVALAGLSLLAWLIVDMHTADLERETLQGALRLSDVLRRSTRTNMLRNRKKDVYEMMQTVGGQPGIERLRIFNKEGRITFSTAPGEAGQTVDKQAEACTRCHRNGQALPRPMGEKLTRIFEVEGHRVLGLIAPVYNEAGCAGPACHVGPEEQQVLGVLDVQMSLSGIDRALEQQNRRFLGFVYLLMLVIASTCGVFVWRFVHTPVKALIQGTERIRDGQLEHRIPLQGASEIGQLAESFNQMAAELGRAQQQLRDWTRTLEQRVEEKTHSLQEAQARLVHNEKMASLGALAAVVAHEINNPLSGVLTYTKLVRKLTGGKGPSPERVSAIHKYLETMERETVRCGHIVENLLEFSRQSGMTAGQASVNDILDRTLFLIGHKLELQGIELKKNLAPELPSIMCDPDQIQQALLAILINAAEAMPEGGELRASTRMSPGHEGEGPCVEVEVSDTGVGIPKEVMPRLFEPFFSTKQTKKGVGLGLSVVYGIVKRHQGRIDVQSQPDSGATFVVSLPERTGVEQEILALDQEERS